MVRTQPRQVADNYTDVLVFEHADWTEWVFANNEDEIIQFYSDDWTPVVVDTWTQPR